MAPQIFRLMVLVPPDFIQLVIVVFKHIYTNSIDINRLDALNLTWLASYSIILFEQLASHVKLQKNILVLYIQLFLIKSELFSCMHCAKGVWGCPPQDKLMFLCL